jgi:hypothetical protein
MLGAQKVLYEKLTCRLGCVKKTKFGAKNKTFCETYFVFLH